MLCPNCKHDQELTWKKYLLGRKHLCPGCGSRYKTILNFFHLFEMALLTTIIGAISIFTAFYIFNLEIFGAAFSAFAAVAIVVFPMDKSFDNKNAKIQITKKDQQDTGTFKH